MKTLFRDLDLKTQDAISEEIDRIVMFTPHLWDGDIDLGATDMEYDDIYVETGSVFVPTEYSITYHGTNDIDDPTEIECTKWENMFTVKQAINNFEE